MSNKTTMVVARKYRLTEPKSYKDGTWKENGQRELVHEKIVPRAFVEERNQHNNNELYVIDEEKTLEIFSKKGAKAPVNDEPKEEVSQKTGTPNKDWTVDEIKSFMDENEIEYDRRLKSKSKLLEIINEQ